MWIKIAFLVLGGLGVQFLYALMGEVPYGFLGPLGVPLVFLDTHPQWLYVSLAGILMFLAVGDLMFLGPKSQYVKSTLGPNEVILQETYLHWIIYVPSIILTVFFPPLVLFFIFTSIVRRTSEFAVTNKRLVHKTGIIGRKIKEVSFSKIESVACNQGILGRILNYGNVVITGSGGSTQTLKSIKAPVALTQSLKQAAGI